MNKNYFDRKFFWGEMNVNVYSRSPLVPIYDGQESEIIFSNGASTLNEPVLYYDPNIDLWISPEELADIEHEAQRDEYEDLRNLGVR